MRIAILILVVPLATVLMLNVHELTHTAAALALGDPHASYRVFGEGCIGCNEFDATKLTPVGNMVNAVAGVAATQALGWLLIGTTASVRHRQRWQSVIETIAGVFFLDALWQLVQVLPANLHLQDGLRRIDYADLLYLARIELGVSPILGKWVLTVAVAASLLGGFRALRRLRC